MMPFYNRKLTSNVTTLQRYKESLLSPQLLLLKVNIVHRISAALLKPEQEVILSAKLSYFIYAS